MSVSDVNHASHPKRLALATGQGILYRRPRQKRKSGFAKQDGCLGSQGHRTARRSGSALLIVVYMGRYARPMPPATDPALLHARFLCNPAKPDGAGRSTATHSHIPNFWGRFKPLRAVFRGWVRLGTLPPPKNGSWAFWLA